MKRNTTKIILMTTFTCVQHEGRLKEWNDCLKVNAENPHIDKVIVFLHTAPERDPEDVFPALKNEKAGWIRYQPMPTFEYLFNYAAENHSGDYCVIANGDIYFEPDSNIQRIREIQARRLWLISRHDLVKGQWVNRMVHTPDETYDAFGFLSPLPDFESDIIIGKVDCDPYLRQKAQRSGIPVLNPSKTIIGRHKDFVSPRTDGFRKPVQYLENSARYNDEDDYRPGTGRIAPASLGFRFFRFFT